MKAVLMNSADKIWDNGTLAPEGSFLGMTRTVTVSTEFSTYNWLTSVPFSDSTIPLDERMGTGHLNANRAFQQFSPGEWDVDGTDDVPLIGWDYGLTDGIVNNLPDLNKHVFDQPLLGGSYVSITLAWDRVIEFDEDANMNGQFDPGDTFQSFESPAAPTDSFNDMNLFLMPKGSTDYGDAIAISFGQDTNVEHIFAEIPTTGEYEFTWPFTADLEVGMVMLGF